MVSELPGVVTTLRHQGAVTDQMGFGRPRVATPVLHPSTWNAKGPSRMSDTRSRERKTIPDDGLLRSGLWAVFMGLIGLLTAFVVVATRWNNESGVAALAAVASSIAAIMSAYFGIQYSQRTGAAASGKKRRAK